MSGTIRVEVAYATPGKQAVIAIDVPVGCTIEEAIERSAIRDEFPGLVIDPAMVGVFGKKCSPDHELAQGDRVEIYRPLIADPKEARKRRAKAASGEN